MDTINPIDISSSDSELDWNLDDYRMTCDTPPMESPNLTAGSKLPASMVPSVNFPGPTSSTSGGTFPFTVPPMRNLTGAASSSSNGGRILPPSVASSPSRNFPGLGGQFEKDSSAKRASTSNGNSFNIIRHSPAKLQLPSLSNNSTQANFYIGRDDKANYYRTDDYKKPSSAGSSNIMEHLAGSLLQEAHARSNSSYWTTVNNGKSHFRDPSRGDDDDLIMYRSTGNGALPPSWVHGKSGSTLQHVNPNDPLHRLGVGEERIDGGDERLIYQAALQDLNQPKVEANLPEGLLSVSLLRHQKIALAWMLQKETRSLHCLGGILADDQGLGKTISMIALIQMQKSLQAKCKSEDLGNHKTEALNLDEDDDSGSAVPDKAKQNGESEDIKPKSEGSTSIREFRRGRPAAGTLVVCPASVLRQWARELDEKVADEAKLKVLVYHGGNRTKDPVELAKYDVVLTTYSIVTNEVPKQPLVEEDEDEPKDGEGCGLSSEFSFNKKRKKLTNNGGKKRRKGQKGIDSSTIDCGGTLAKVGWFRVILDEAQTIKNHRTQVARACCGLRAKRRWCLSGTPIQNAIDELFSYFRFLRYDPYAAYKSFCKTIKIPISRNSIHGYKKLQAVLRAIMLRRTKGTLIDGEPIIKLPPKTVRLNKVDFSSEERAFYSRLEADSRSKFKAYAAAGTVNQNYANILLMLLRLRQACDHPLLVKEFNSDSVGKVSLEMAKRLPVDMLINLLNLLETSLAICHVCNDPPEDAVVTMCGHVFCYQCVSEYLTGDDNTCPVHECKEQLGADVVFSKATLRSCLSDPDGNPSSSSQVSDTSMVPQNEHSSSKIKAALDIIRTHCLLKSPGSMLDDFVDSRGSSSLVCMDTDSDGGAAKHHGTSEPHSEGLIKAIIFSQWTGMLDLVEMSLNEHCIQYRRLDGSMTLLARDRAVKEFNTDPEVTVMLMSLKAGNLGLNMVAACHVILLDLWWNPTTEDQAIDRAHRIGQTRPVTVSRLTIKDTVEDRILALQEEKRKMVASAFGEDPSGGSATRLTVEDLKYLFMV